MVAGEGRAVAAAGFGGRGVAVAGELLNVFLEDWLAKPLRHRRRFVDDEVAVGQRVVMTPGGLGGALHAGIGVVAHRAHVAQDSLLEKVEQVLEGRAVAVEDRAVLAGTVLAVEL